MIKRSRSLFFPFLSVLFLSSLWAVKGKTQVEETVGDQCGLPPEVSLDHECAFWNYNDGKMLHLRLHGGQEFHFPLDSHKELLREKNPFYQYNESLHLLSFTDYKGKRIFLTIDPGGKFPSQLVYAGTFKSKACPLFPFNFSYENGHTRLGKTTQLNGGILFSSGEKYIVRSRNLGFKNFVEMSKKIQEKDLTPIISSKCLKRFAPDVFQLKCSDPGYQAQVKKLREEIRNSSCAPFLGDGGPKSPLIIHLHATGFGGPDGRGEYGLEQIKLAEVFGYRFFHPFHKDHPTPLTGGDIFRPIFFQKNETEDRMVRERKISSHLVFDFKKSDQAVEEIYNSVQDPVAREKKLGESMDKFHFYSPKTINGFLSAEARACLQLTPETIEKRRKDSRKYTGSWKSLLDILDLIADKNNSQVFFHCDGGRHKTGALALSLRYLQDPRWLYGPKRKMSFGVKTDTHTGEENLSWAGDNQSFWERHQFEKFHPEESSLKNILQMVFLPEKGWFNPAETEYLSHNEGQVRMSNLTATRDLFRALYESQNEAYLSQMKKKYNLDERTMKEILARLQNLRDKMQSENTEK